MAVWLCGYTAPRKDKPAERESFPLSLLSNREIEHRLLCDGSGGSVPLCSSCVKLCVTASS